MAHRYLWGPNVPVPQPLPASRADALLQSSPLGASSPAPQRLPVSRAGMPLIDAILPVPPVSLTSPAGSAPGYPVLLQDPAVPIQDPEAGRSTGSHEGVDTALFRELTTPDIPWLLGDVAGASGSRERGEPPLAPLGPDALAHPATGGLHDDYVVGGDIADDADEGFVMLGYDENGNLVSHGEGDTWRMVPPFRWLANAPIRDYWDEHDRAPFDEARRAHGHEGPGD